MLSTRPKENWGNLADKDGPSGFYLGNNKAKVKSALTFGKFKEVPILKNGSLMPHVTLDKRSISLQNTCAFDSFFQVFLVSACDDDNIKKKVIFIINVF